MNWLIRKVVRRAKATKVYRRWQAAAERRRQIRQFWEFTATDKTRTEFYQQLIDPGMLVFDVGANYGNRSRIFHAIGATVVAFEPQADCLDFLKEVFQGRDRFHLEPVALGAATEEREFLVCEANTISSLSPEWIAAVQNSGRFENFRWDRSATIRVETLDHMIARYGVPGFLKIDVEGFEAEVLAGLSRPVSSLSFEFTPEYLENSFRCVAKLTSLGDYEYQISLGESMEFAFDDWCDHDTLQSRLQAIPAAAFGDVYARCTSSPPSLSPLQVHGS